MCQGKCSCNNKLYVLKAYDLNKKPYICMYGKDRSTLNIYIKFRFFGEIVYEKNESYKISPSSKNHKFFNLQNKNIVKYSIEEYSYNIPILIR